METTLTRLKASIDAYTYEYQQLQITLHSTYLEAETYYTKQHELITNAMKIGISYENPKMPQDFEQTIKMMENDSIRLEALIDTLNQKYLDLQDSRDRAYQLLENSRDLANTMAQTRAADNIARMKQARETPRSKTLSVGGK